MLYVHKCNHKNYTRQMKEVIVMTYAILLEIVGTSTEIRIDIRGTESLEKFTDNRILSIYKREK